MFSEAYNGLIMILFSDQKRLKLFQCAQFGGALYTVSKSNLRVIYHAALNGPKNTNFLATIVEYLDEITGRMLAKHAHKS